MPDLTSLTRSISPPLTRKASSVRIQKPKSAVAASNDHHQDEPLTNNKSVELLDAEPTLAAIEAGQAQIRDHLEYFSRAFSSVIRPVSGPRLSIDDFRALYKRNQHPHGRHFVIHQHDHPISGTTRPSS